MVASTVFPFVLVALASTAQAVPLNKRIAQTISASTTQWVQACQAAGGAEQCGTVSQTAFMTLLAAAGPCDQQNAADQMIDLAKSLNNDADMVKLAQIFVQQPRNSPDSFSIPYCQQAPSNTELNGLFQCQFDGTKDTFVGNLQPGAAGTVPFGLQSLATPKSCPANTQGGVPDGQQLSDITQDPGLQNVNSSGGSGNSSSRPASGSADSSAATSPVIATASTDSSAATASATATASSDDPDDSGDSDGSSCATETAVSSAEVTEASSVASGTTTGSAASASASSSSSSFLFQNGQDAQKLNAQFQTLSANSSCTSGESACVNGSFALCNNGQFALMPCGSDVTCAALPLVNKAGTSVTCVTAQDAIDRITATGATGGLTGSD